MLPAAVAERKKPAARGPGGPRVPWDVSFARRLRSPQCSLTELLELGVHVRDVFRFDIFDVVARIDDILDALREFPCHAAHGADGCQRD